jgi:hypothetical protein
MKRPAPAQVAELMDNLRPYLGKSCGSCTACCSSVPVKEIGLKAWTRCPHLHSLPSIHTGCSIYSRRPSSCRVWSCGWLVADWSDDLKPDRCGVIVDPMEDLVWVNGKELSVTRLWVLPGHEDDFNRQPVLALILAIIDGGMGVIWDMAPDKTGQALSRLLLRQDGKLQMGPPTPPTPENQMRMNFAERYWRSRMARP